MTPMDKQPLIETLQQIKVLVDKALKDSGANPPKNSSAKAKATSANAPDSLPDHILKLRDKGLLKEPLTFQEVHSKLAKIYPCDVSRVKVACLRLQKRKLLRKTSKKIENRKQVAYVW
jgi:hypothetical protein